MVTPGCPRAPKALSGASALREEHDPAHATIETRCRVERVRVGTHETRSAVEERALGVVLVGDGRHARRLVDGEDAVLVPEDGDLVLVAAIVVDDDLVAAPHGITAPRALLSDEDAAVVERLGVFAGEPDDELHTLAVPGPYHPALHLRRSTVP
jgi:hypothetical protein